MGPRISDSIPVLPYLIYTPGKSDVRHVFSLYDPLNADDSAVAWDTPETGALYPYVDTEASLSSLSELASLGFTSSVTVGLRAESSLHISLHKVLFYRKVANTLYDQGSAIHSLTLGLGFRLAIVCWDIDAKAQLSSPSGIAASTDLRMVGSQFDAHLLGADADALRFFVPVLNQAGNGFDANALGAFEKASSELVDYFGSRTKQRALHPAVVSVNVDFDRVGSKTGQFPLKNVLASEMYALFMVAHQRFSPNQALAHSHNNPNHWPKSHIDDDVVRSAYADHFGLRGDERPTEAQAKLAWDYTKTTRY